MYSKLLSLVYAVFIMPLQLFFEVLFSYAQKFTNNPGFSIILLSLSMNFLVLPLYKRADAIQDSQREIEKKLKPEVDHIKKAFSGDERMMILQTFYRHNYYKPTDVIKGSVSLLLQVPFFIAAYHFLSNLKLLSGVSFGPINDLAAPDAMIAIGSISVNILPVIMTAINILSSMIYTKGMPMKSKIQLYGMALIFFVLLYPSPSGLVFYWTLNNLFSLVKNVILKLKNPGKMLSIISSLAGAVLITYSVFFFDNTLKRKIITCIIGILLLIPIIYSYMKKAGFFRNWKSNCFPGPDKNTFLISGLMLTILIGGVIPSAVIKSSPQEFIDPNYYLNPLWYIAYSLCLAFGTFVIWAGVFYKIADEKRKIIIEVFLWAFDGVALIDYLFFGTNLGVLSPQLQYDTDISFGNKEKTINIIIIIIVSLLFTAILYLKKQFISVIQGAVIISLTVMTVWNVTYIQKSIMPVSEILKVGQENFNITLSRKGKNVIVLMLDRAAGPYIPYIMNEKPELMKQFDGFTYYSNTISFGPCTNTGSPAIFGGYEYTPVEMNRKDDKLLKDKHNEALRLMPYLFDDKGYKVTVCNPVYADYQWIPDLRIYWEHPDIIVFSEQAAGTDRNVTDGIGSKNFFLYGLMKSSPLILQKYLYNGGWYNRQEKGETGSSQVRSGPHIGKGLNSSFVEKYDYMSGFGNNTVVSDDVPGSFFMMDSNITHEPMLLQEPEYVPLENVDNEEYDLSHTDRFNLNDSVLRIENENQFSHYEINMATMILLGKWFDDLRKKDVYDNTRIILVSDHGTGFGEREELITGLFDKNWNDANCYSCLLMMKDFDSSGFTESSEFMTNGDVPTMAFSGIIDSPVNPFTGKDIDDSAKDAPWQYVIGTDEFRIDENNGYQYKPADWLAVHDDIWKTENWKLIEEDSVYTGSDKK